MQVGREAPKWAGRHASGQEAGLHASGPEAGRQQVGSSETETWAMRREQRDKKVGKRQGGNEPGAARPESGQEGAQTCAQEKRRRAPRISARTSSGFSFGRSPTFSTFHVRASEVRTCRPRAAEGTPSG